MRMNVNNNFIKIMMLLQAAATTTTTNEIYLDHQVLNYKVHLLAATLTGVYFDI